MTTLSIHRGKARAEAPARTAPAPVAAAPVEVTTTQPTSEADRMKLWMTLIIGVLVIALASIVAAVVLILMGKSDLASGAWPIATAAVAGIVGLFAKSPTAG
jgi:steroid 5-alpha reductase family enzyme